MALSFHLSTSSSFPKGPKPVVELGVTNPIEKENLTYGPISSRFSGFKPILSLTFPAPGLVQAGTIEGIQGTSHYLTADHPRAVAVWAKLNPMIHDPVEFTISPVGSNDSCVIFAFDYENFVGTMLHGRPPSPNIFNYSDAKAHPCVVACADGKTGQPCVTCVSGNVRIRICC
jgi:hypothetical protein